MYIVLQIRRAFHSTFCKIQMVFHPRRAGNWIRVWYTATHVRKSFVFLLN